MFLPSNLMSDVIALSIVIQSAIIIILSIEPGIENVIMMVYNNIVVHMPAIHPPDCMVHDS